MQNTDLAIYHNGEISSFLNIRLVEKQQLDQVAIETLKKLHAQHSQIDLLMAEIDDAKTLRHLFRLRTLLECEIQETWKFDLDWRMHRWYECPKCTCPRMDNRDDAPYRLWLDNSCPVHGYSRFVLDMDETVNLYLENKC